MSEQAMTSGPVGWFGKLPAAGDFLRHQLPDSFTAAWDAWLQTGMSVERAILAERWQECYLCFPVWHFLRSARDAAAGQRPADSLWAGILAPSVDRVGRLFPITVAFDIPVNVFMHVRFSAIKARLAEIETATLEVLGNDDLPAFQQRLAAITKLQVDHAIVDPPGAQDFGATNVATSPEAMIEIYGKQALCERLSAHTVFWTGDRRLLAVAEPLQPHAFGELVQPHDSLIE
jgi:type VI secretion system ImpM family protein